MIKNPLTIFRKYSLLLLSTFYFLFSISSVFALGLQVKPSEFNLSGSKGEKILTHLSVANPSSEVSVFEVYPDSFEFQIKTSPSSFILESGESREVAVILTFNEIGQFKTNLSIISRPLSKISLSAAGGLKIPITLNIQEKNTNLAASVFIWFGAHQNSLVGFAAFIAILVFGIFILQKFLRKEKN